MLKLDADRVIRSACNTAAADGNPDAHGLTGHAKAFSNAGPGSLPVSHWAVRSDAAFCLRIGAFAALAKESSIGPAEALMRSMMAMRDPSQPDAFGHPQAWAPFILTGGGRQRQ
jgi:CHAT domain-containing protein